MRAGVERAGRSDQATGVHHQRALAIDADADIASDLHRGAADFERTPRRAKFTDHQGPLARGSPATLCRDHRAVVSDNVSGPGVTDSKLLVVPVTAHRGEPEPRAGCAEGINNAGATGIVRLAVLPTGAPTWSVPTFAVPFSTSSVPTICARLLVSVPLFFSTMPAEVLDADRAAAWAGDRGAGGGLVVFGADLQLMAGGKCADRRHCERRRARAGRAGEVDIGRCGEAAAED